MLNRVSKKREQILENCVITLIPHLKDDFTPELYTYCKWILDNIEGCETSYFPRKIEKQLRNHKKNLEKLNEAMKPKE